MTEIKFVRINRKPNGSYRVRVGKGNHEDSPAYDLDEASSKVKKAVKALLDAIESEG